MTTAERLPKNMSANNVLYARLRSRFCDNGDVTLGERMMQASTRMNTVSTTVLSEDDTDGATSLYDPTVAARPTAARSILLRKLLAGFLTLGVLLCLTYALYRTVSLPAGQSQNSATFAIAPIDASKVNTNIGAATTEDEAVFAAAYADFCTAFED